MSGTVVDWYARVERLAGLTNAFVAGRFKASYGGRCLFFGDLLCGLAMELLPLGWECLRITDSETPFAAKGEELIRGIVTPDPRIVKTISGFWMRSLTVVELFRQFPGPYDIIGMVGTNQDRALFQQESIQAALPTIYIVGEDGHNEDVIKLGIERGYAAFLAPEALILVHE